MNPVRVDFWLTDALMARINQYARRVSLTPEDVLHQSAVRWVRLVEQGAPLLWDDLDMRTACEVFGYTGYCIFSGGRNACIVHVEYAAAPLTDQAKAGYGTCCRYSTVVHACETLEACGGVERSESLSWRQPPATSDDKLPSALYRQSVIDSARGKRNRRGRPAGQTAFETGSLAGRLWVLRPREIALCVDTVRERRACYRAIARIKLCDPRRDYDTAPWWAGPRIGMGEILRILHICRTA